MLKNRTGISRKRLMHKMHVSVRFSQRYMQCSLINRECCGRAGSGFEDVGKLEAGALGKVGDLDLAHRRDVWGWWGEETAEGLRSEDERWLVWMENGCLGGVLGSK